MTNKACPKAGKGPDALWIVYNGEIYNYQQLRQELLANGHRFSSKTDTEVILHLYEEEAEQALDRLNGMFAFAIYDPNQRALFLARDRLGIKPLFYAEQGGSFSFASEIKAILAAGIVPREVDWQAISDYFTFGFVPHPETAFRFIRQLPPASTLPYDLKTRSVRIRTYWTPWSAPSVSHQQKPKALVDQVRSLLSDSVKMQLVSDVPLGVFFSGGIDSTLLTALMRQHTQGKVQTFTIGFTGYQIPPLQDDLYYARLASRVLGTEHHELIVNLTSAEEFLATIQTFDQPFTNPTAYLQRLIAQETRQHVTVALAGVGGDELFGGYPRHRLFPFSQALSSLPTGPARCAHRLLSLIREDACDPVLRQTKRLLRGVGLDLPQQYVAWTYSLSEEEKVSLLKLPGSPFRPASRLLREKLAALPKEVDRYGRFLYADLTTFLVDNLLEYTDKASMAVALEVRVPFLDHRLVELAAQIPFREKVSGGNLKVCLKRLFQRELPPEIRNAPKRGFAPPIAQWVDTIFNRYFDEVLTRQQVERQGIFSWEALQSLRRAHRGRRRNASPELLGILIFDAWFRRYAPI